MTPFWFWVMEKTQAAIGKIFSLVNEKIPMFLKRLRDFFLFLRFVYQCRILTQY